MRNLNFKAGERVFKKSGSITSPAEVRAQFTSRKGKPMLVLEYDKDIFRVIRAQQAVRADELDASGDTVDSGDGVGAVATGVRSSH